VPGENLLQLVLHDVHAQTHLGELVRGVFLEAQLEHLVGLAVGVAQPAGAEAGAVAGLVGKKKKGHTHNHATTTSTDKRRWAVGLTRVNLGVGVAQATGAEAGALAGLEEKNEKRNEKKVTHTKTRRATT